MKKLLLALACVGLIACSDLTAPTFDNSSVELLGDCDSTQQKDREGYMGEIGGPWGPTPWDQALLENENEHQYQYTYEHNHRNGQ